MRSISMLAVLGMFVGNDVAVLDAPVVSDAFASATSRQLVLAVPEVDEESLGEVLAAVGDDRVRVVGRG